MNLRNWFDPNWRQELTNALIIGSVLAISGVIGTTVYSFMTKGRPPLYVFLGGGAVVGLLIGFFVYLLVSAPTPTKDESNPTKETPSATALPLSSPLAPPIAVTGMFVSPPYEVGKKIHAVVEVNSSVFGVKLRAAYMVVMGAIANESNLKPEMRRETEKGLWEKYEELNRDKVPESLNSVAGPMTLHIDGEVMTDVHVAALKSENGIVYVMGQIDYGSGTLEFCGYAMPGRHPNVYLCMDHNRLVARPVFK